MTPGRRHDATSGLELIARDLTCVISTPQIASSAPTR
jgi:hypothetical protein